MRCILQSNFHHTSSNRLSTHEIDLNCPVESVRGRRGKATKKPAPVTVRAVIIYFRLLGYAEEAHRRVIWSRVGARRASNWCPGASREVVARLERAGAGPTDGDRSRRIARDAHLRSNGAGAGADLDIIHPLVLVQATGAAADPEVAARDRSETGQRQIVVDHIAVVLQVE